MRVVISWIQDILSIKLIGKLLFQSGKALVCNNSSKEDRLNWQDLITFDNVKCPLALDHCGGCRKFPFDNNPCLSLLWRRSISFTSYIISFPVKEIGSSTTKNSINKLLLICNLSSVQIENISYWNFCFHDCSYQRRSSKIIKFEFSRK